MTPAQLPTLKAAILAETDAAFVALRTAGATGAMADWYNVASTFVSWRTDVTSDQTGNAWVGTDIDGMSALNMQRLQLLLASSSIGIFDMSRDDRRAGFENPFGTNANNASRVAMRAAWKRFATRGEKLFATGTGTDTTPGKFGSFQGSVTNSDIVQAINLP